MYDSNPSDRFCGGGCSGAGHCCGGYCVREVMLLVVVVGVVMVVRLLLCGGCDGGRCGSNRSGEWSLG